MGFHVPEKFRVTRGMMASKPSDGNNGGFFIPRNNHKTPLKVVASDGMDWEHVSVSLPDRPPTWDEMCQVKDLFWDEEDLVVQYHPPRSNYIDIHPNCLHLWRAVGQEIPAPPAILVGFE